MDANPSHSTTSSDLEHAPYIPLPEHPLPATIPVNYRRRLKSFSVIFASVIFLLSLVALVINQSQEPLHTPSQNRSPSALLNGTSFSKPEPRGVAQGVSAKSNPSFLNDGRLSYNWTKAMFSFQRTAYHFQPEENWMNDPDGPLFYKGWYHLFYQYNPDSAIWGNITWGHTVSRDLIHWFYLPIALRPTEWYDFNGTWTGSATLLPDGQIKMLYTGDTNNSVQVQCLAYPANLSDPLLLNWVKYENNPVIVPPPGIGKSDFRDPTTAWYVALDGMWRIAIGSKINKTGMALVYTTKDFYTYKKLEGVLHKVPNTGMWECVDFYPVATNGSTPLNTSAMGPGVKHVLKASMDDTRVDQYAIGTYDPTVDKWTPDNPAQDVGIGLRYDYGRFYASKTFYDQNKDRRVLFGWINETDSEADDLEKGWASLQTIPRTVLFDNKTKNSLLQWPVDEIESLRLNSTDFKGVLVEPGSIVPLDIGMATQLDIFAEFETELISETTTEEYGCGGGAIERSNLGPFGLLVLADQSLSELTPIFFRHVNQSDGILKTYFCVDETRSSLATGVFKQVYGTTIPVLKGEKLHMRILVDHSIVESFGQRGRRVISSRIYPTEAIYENARLFLFNNATGVNVKATLKIWELNSAFIHPYPLDQ